MELSRQEYPALLQSLDPNQAVAILEDRVRLVGKVNTDIAEWLSERRRVEEAYVQGLKKLGAKHPHTASPELGIFQTPWQSIISSTDSLARSHATFAHRMEADVERPLREYQKGSREMQAMSTIQGNLAAVGRELDTAQKRVEKVKAGKSSGNKVADATAGVETLRREWDSQAPYVFEQLQALDENRINHLRDVLTQLQTHEVDQVERNRVSAESCLNVLLNVDTADEISTFVAKSSSGPPTMQQAPVRSRQTPANHLSTPTPSRTQDDRASEISATSEGNLRSGSASGPPAPATPERKPRGFGLRRLGTVMSRRKDSKNAGDRPSSPEKRSRPVLSGLRRGTSSKNMQTIPSPDEEAMPMPKSPPHEISTSPHPIRSQTMAASPSPPEPRRTSGRVNGDTIQPAPTRSSSLPVPNGLPASSSQVEGQPPVPPPPTSQIQRDTEGFNVAPPAVDEISRAQQEAAASEPDQPQFKLDIRSEPIHEEELDAQSALSDMANTLRAQAQSIPTPRKPSANRGRRDVRNTVFVPSPQPSDVPSFGESPAPSQGTFSSGKANSPSSELMQGSDARSIRSTHSVSSSLAQTAAAKHPEMMEPGLNASVVETVSAWFSAGQVTRAVVIGELALAHNNDSSSDSSSDSNDNSTAPITEIIRLENFPVLEKVAPNPTFITPIPSRSGEYTLNLAHISSSSSSSSTTTTTTTTTPSATKAAIAFKYQVHLPPPHLAAYAPVLLTANWKLEPTQTSVIVAYAFNPSFVSPAHRGVTLKNVVVMIHLDPAAPRRKPTSCQSKPVGHFSREKAVVFWRMDEVVLDAYGGGDAGAGGGGGKLLARFVNEGAGEGGDGGEGAEGMGMGKVGSVEARWEIGGEAAEGLGSGLSLAVREDGAGVGGGGGGAGRDPFADEGASLVGGAGGGGGRGWREVKVQRKIVSGKYVAV